MTPTVKLAEYLFTRLKQLGVGAIHGVPGDFNLSLLDYVEPTGLHWVGNANELNAGYAADGYARIKGVGAIITTFGVGELSAINAIAGAYAERAAVVHIVGTPPRASQDAGLLIHHTFNDGNYRRFGQMYTHVTVAQASLRDPRTGPEQIDHVLTQCILQSRPVYIEVPVDLVAAPVAAARLQDKIQIPDAVPTPALEKALSYIVEKIQSSDCPIILVDGETRALGIVDEVQRLSAATNWPTWTTAFGKGLLDESLLNFHGVYRGPFATADTKSLFSTASPILCFGPHFSSTNSYNYAAIPPPATTLAFSVDSLTFGPDARHAFRDVPLKPLVSKLAALAAAGTLAPARPPPPNLARDTTLAFADVGASERLDHDKLWRLLAGAFLRAGDVVLGETGTSGHGVREMRLPPRARLFAPATWLSIGYMLPAAVGAARAQREAGGGGRTVLFIGDGSLQMTVQELGTAVKEGLGLVVFVVNNDGYTIERCIHGLREGYNDVGRWRYLKAPEFFGADEGAYTAEVRTWGQLEEVLRDERLVSGEGLRMVELVMGKEDAPKGPLLSLLQKERQRLSEGS